MKRSIIILTSLLLTLILTTHAGAELLDRGKGLIYDDILDITWLQNANYSEGTLKWDYAISWADNLNFKGYNDWRLPASDTSCTGKNCTGSEMGQLYYYYNITANAAGIFNDVRPYMYWSADELSLNAWRFHFGTGYQGASSKEYTRYAWAVRDGDSTTVVVPEPTGLVLFITGWILLAGRLRKQ